MIFICYDLIQIFGQIASFNFQVSWGHQLLTEIKRILDFGIFLLGLSDFWIGAWFSFDVFQFNQQLPSFTCIYLQFRTVTYSYLQLPAVTCSYMQLPKAAQSYLKLRYVQIPIFSINGLKELSRDLQNIMPLRLQSSCLSFSSRWQGTWRQHWWSWLNRFQDVAGFPAT